MRVWKSMIVDPRICCCFIVFQLSDKNFVINIDKRERLTMFWQFLLGWCKIFGWLKIRVGRGCLTSTSNMTHAQIQKLIEFKKIWIRFPVLLSIRSDGLWDQEVQKNLWKTLEFHNREGTQSTMTTFQSSIKSVWPGKTRSSFLNCLR